MKHENLQWNPGTRQWFCAKCGRTSDHTAETEARAALDQFECRIPSVDTARAAPGTETTRLIRKPYKMKLKRERSGCKFLVKETEEGPEIMLELFHDAPSLQPISLGFEVLRGSTVAQTRTLVDAMNERIVGIIVTHK